MFDTKKKYNRFIAPIVGLDLSGPNICARAIHQFHMRSFKAISSQPDYIEVKQETAYLRSTGENPCSALAGNMGLHIEITQVSKIGINRGANPSLWV